jgi:choline dehydrogenase-like flavoprotein
VTERVDVLIAGSGFGGSIMAWRLAELYEAAGASPSSVVVLERGRDMTHTDFRQSMDVQNLADVYKLESAVSGAQFVAGNLVGGSSNVYLAASLRAPTQTFERRDRRPDDPPTRRMWPAALSRATLDPYYARVEAALRVFRPGWDRVSRPGGAWAAMLNAAGHTCDRVPIAIDPQRCVNANWCHTGCIFAAKNSLITNYLGAARAAGVQVRPLTQIESVQQTSARPWRYVVTVSQLDPATLTPVSSSQIMCKVCVLATGALADAPVLMRSRAALPALSSQVGRNVGCNGDHLASIELNPGALGLPGGYDHFYEGPPITTMSYDWFNGADGTRFNLQEIFLSTLTTILYDSGRPPGGWFGLSKKQALANWAAHIEILALVEDTHDGTFVLAPPVNDAVQVNAGPTTIATLVYSLSEQSVAVRQAANAAIASVAHGVGKFQALTETDGIFSAHPLGGCRMADSAALGAVDDAGNVYGYEGLLCVGSSIIPTSLSVNPSLTVSAVAERCAEKLIAQASGYGLPSAAVQPGVPPLVIGPHATAA